MNWKIPPIGTWGGISTLLAALTLLVATAVQASAAPWQQLRPVGQGEMSWLWFKLYDATLYSESGRYEPGRYPQALTLTYARAIEREDLLSATSEEATRLAMAIGLALIDEPLFQAGGQLAGRRLGVIGVVAFVLEGEQGMQGVVAIIVPLCIESLGKQGGVIVFILQYQMYVALRR